MTWHGVNVPFLFYILLWLLWFSFIFIKLLFHPVILLLSYLFTKFLFTFLQIVQKSSKIMISLEF